MHFLILWLLILYPVSAVAGCGFSRPREQALERECPICFHELEEDSEKKVLILKCDPNRPKIGHRFHSACLDRWRGDKSSSVKTEDKCVCPTCKQPPYATEIATKVTIGDLLMQWLAGLCDPGG